MTVTPTVSICLPTYNSMAFLKERVDSIREQTFGDWEVVVGDSSSTDGTREYLQAWADEDPRVTIHDIPREGIYPAFNFCLSQTRGEFVTIATSDDTMDVKFLEEMTRALHEHPECGYAHTRLITLDQNGNETTDYWRNSVFVRSDPNASKMKHIRRAPMDGLLHIRGSSVYTSLTQLLVRRHAVDAVGPFPTEYGTVGDINWDMKLAMQFHCVHVPSTYATWRLHDGQATAQAWDGDLQMQRVRNAITGALKESGRQLDQASVQDIARSLNNYHSQRLEWVRSRFRIGSRVKRWLQIGRDALAGNSHAVNFVLSKTLGMGDWNMPAHLELVNAMTAANVKLDWIDPIDENT